MMDQVYEYTTDMELYSVIYAGSDGKAYVDSALTQQYKTSDLLDAYSSGSVVFRGDGEYIVPIGFYVDSNLGHLRFLVDDESDDHYAIIVTLVSDADPPEN